jgi:hexosaminidase
MSLWISALVLSLLQQSPSEWTERLLPVPAKLTLMEGQFRIEGEKEWGPDRPVLFVDIDTRVPFACEHVQMVKSVLAGEEIIGEWFDEGYTGSPPKAGELAVRYSAELAEEEYRLVVNESIWIYASTLRGLARATSTLMQLWPRYGGEIPAMEIRDRPANAYRSFMVDIGRHPIGIETLKETIDLLWYYKMDSLHLHLTDDQHFSFPSKAFPKLVTERGKISWEQFSELDEYARLRGIHLIPELEVPGHSTILRREYPEVFGKTPTELAQSPVAREGMKKLIDELIELFPSSPYIHIGGDEAYGVPEELQRELINDLNRYLKKRGKSTLVWEGPRLGEGDNKVDEDVVHINWRTINFPAPEMLKAGYKVVNAAWDPLYLVDHYPRNNFTMASPAHIYQRLELQRFGHFNPGMPTFAKPHLAESRDNIIGYCMPWWEGREQNYLPMVVPHVIPLAAVAWSEPSVRDVDEFHRRSQSSEAKRRELFYPIHIDATDLVVPSAGVFHRQTEVSLKWTWPDWEPHWSIHYTLDGSRPTKKSAQYQKPFGLKKSAVVRAEAFREGYEWQGYEWEHGSRRTFVKVDPVDNLALGKPVTTSVAAGPVYCAELITDGGAGNLDYFLGYPAMPEPIAITIDLEQAQSVGKVVMNTYQSHQSYESYQLQVSADGSQWDTVADRREKPGQPASAMVHEFPAQQVRYIRVLSSGHKGQVFDSFSRITEVQAYPGHPVSELMHGFMREHKVPGASVAVTKDGELVYSRGFGWADTGSKSAVTNDSIFRIASISKPITSAAVLTLVDAGKLDLNSPVVDLLYPVAKPNFPDSRLNKITLRQLLQHRGGWDRNKSSDPMFVAQELASNNGDGSPLTKKQIRDVVFQLPLDFDPGAQFAYSNFGYMLLGLIIEEVTGMAYEDYVTMAILQPLQMMHTKPGRSLIADRKPNEVTYYSPNHQMMAVLGESIGDQVPAPYGGFALETMDAHGGWLSSASDLARFAAAVDLSGDNFLSEESVQTMIARYPTPKSNSKEPVYYGCGWLVRTKLPTNRINLWHNGALPGTSTLLVARHDGYTWAILFNARKAADGTDYATLIDPLFHQAINQVTSWGE